MKNAEKTIRQAMARQGIRTITELAKLTGIRRQTLGVKIQSKPGTFTAYELAAVQKVLRLDNDTVGEIIKGI